MSDSTIHNRRSGIETTRWVREFRLGRVQLWFTLLRHAYGVCSDRWVLQTSWVYDRREKP